MIQEVMTWYKEIMAINPTFASLVGVGLGGWLLMMARSLPKKLFVVVKSQLVTSLVMNNGGHGPNEEQCIAFMTWFKQQPIARFSRKLSMNSIWNGSPSPTTDIGAGFGIHLFFYKGRLFWFNRTKLDSSGTQLEKFQIEIHGLTRNTQLLLDLVEEFRVRGDDKEVCVIPWEGMRWGDSIPITKRAMNTVIMNREQKAEIIGKIEEFFAGREWYESRGMPYKMCAMLSGPPGTGKTSIGKAIASAFNKNIYWLSLASISDELLRKAVTSMPSGSILMIEDFDTNKAVQNRTLKKLTDGEVSELDSLITQFGLGNYQVIDDGVEVMCLWEMMGKDFRVGYQMYNPTEARQHRDDINAGYAESYVNHHGEPLSEFVAGDPMLLRLWELHNRHVNGSEEDTRMGGLTLSGLLNALDGVVPLDGSLILLTTNHPEHLDPALIRKGRVDHQWEIGLLEDAEVRDYIELMFPKMAVQKDVVFRPIAGCDLQALFAEHRHNAVEFIKAIPKDIV